MMKPIWVKRTDSSSYFPPHFHEMEGQRLNSIPGVKYLAVNDPLPDEGDICLITNTHTHLEKWLSVRSRVRFILHPNSGFENLMPAWDNIPVVLGNEIRAQAVAEWSLGCLLQHFSPINNHAVWPRTRSWDRGLIRDQKILVLGAGPIGKKISETLAALGAHVHVSDPHFCHTVQLQQDWSVVILATSINPESRSLLDHTFFSQLRRDALIINGARAEIIAPGALDQFLSANPAARAYLDVHSEEPFLPGGHPQVIRTPHIAGVWHNLIDEMMAFEVRVLQSWAEHGEDGIKAFPLMHDRLTAQGWYR